MLIVWGSFDSSIYISQKFFKCHVSHSGMADQHFIKNNISLADVLT